MQSMKRRIKRVYRNLPLHSYEAHPLTRSGEVSKPLIIGIIAIVAVMALSLLLLFSDQFVGKAIYPGQVGTAGLVYPAVVYENQSFTIQVKANVGNLEAAGVEFELDLPKDVLCKTFVEEFAANVSYFVCNLTVSKVTYLGAKYNPVSGDLNIANITFLGLPTGNYTFVFSIFDVKQANKSSISFSNNVLAPSMLQIVAQLPTYCGDGQVQSPNSAGQTEECDGSDLADQSCQSLGFPNGTLTCSSHCNLDKNMCTGAPLLPPPVFTQGIKISLTDVLPENDVFATEIKANETFTNEVTIDRKSTRLNS